MAAIVDPGHPQSPVSHQWWTFRAEPWILIGLTVVLTLLATYFPPSGDDWAWGSEDGAARYHRWFDHYNGRWAGNLLVLALTRLTWLAPLVVALGACLVVHLLTRVANLRTPAGYAVSILLFVGMPLAMWRQVMVWVSGYSNYVPAVICLLLFVLSVQRDWFARPRSQSPLTVCAVGVLAFVAALFMEHVTVVLVLAAFAHVVALRLRRPQSHRAVALAWLVGAIAGAVLMFSNSIYRSAADGEASYQEVNKGGIGQILYDGVSGVSQLSAGINTVLNVTLLLVLCGLWRCQRGAARNRWQLVAVLSAAVGAVSGIVISSRVKPLEYFGDLNGLAWLSSVGMLVALVLGALHLVDSVEDRRTILWLTGMAFLLIAPATVVQPYTPRVFLPSYVLMSAVCLILLRELLQRREHPWVQVATMTVAGVVSVVILATYFVVYREIDRAEQERISAIRAAVRDGATEVFVPHLPHIGYVHYPDPRLKVYQQRYKEYYGLPDDLVLNNQPRP